MRAALIPNRRRECQASPTSIGTTCSPSSSLSRDRLPHRLVGCDTAGHVRARSLSTTGAFPRYLKQHTINNSILY
jgi:hypothetical protein